MDVQLLTLLFYSSSSIKQVSSLIQYTQPFSSLILVPYCFQFKKRFSFRLFVLHVPCTAFILGCTTVQTFTPCQLNYYETVSRVTSIYFDLHFKQNLSKLIQHHNMYIFFKGKSSNIAYLQWNEVALKVSIGIQHLADIYVCFGLSFSDIVPVITWTDIDFCFVLYFDHLTQKMQLFYCTAEQTFFIYLMDY